MNRYAVEIALHWTGVAGYIVATVAVVFAAMFGKDRARVVGLWAACAGLLFHGAAIALRWVAVGHGPYMLKYEVLSSNAWVAVAAIALLLARRPSWTPIAVVAMPLAILAMAIGMFSNPESRELPPTLRSIWLTFHIVFAKISAAAFLVSMGSSVLLLLRERPKAPAWVARAPSQETLDAIVVRSVGFGFIFWTVTIAAGAIWGNQSWGRYWGWDPIETWSLVSWLTYGTFLHVRLFFRLSPKATAWSSIGCFAIFILALLILPFLIRSLHTSYFT